ncbi:MAG: phytanoyl-CoA dioxygenase family protein [Chitinophagaceae bacterium]
MSISDRLKKYKLLHWLYNLLNSNKLSHNKDAYRQYNIEKKLFASISSKDFPDKTSKAWLDVGDAKQLVQNHPGLNAFPAPIQDALVQWTARGYLIWDHFLDQQTTDQINHDVERLVKTEGLSFTHDNKLPFLMKKSAIIRDVAHNAILLQLLSFILGKEVVPFQTLNFIKGSGQRAHSDSIHMTTYPLGYLIAVWIALEDIHEDAGPLYYYPGSHRLPYLLNDDFGNISTAWKLGQKEYRDYEDVIEDLIIKEDMQKQQFLPKKGDMLIWHANLLHGGEPILNPALTRKSMVIHYYAKDVIKYHEITERPAIL